MKKTLGLLLIAIFLMSALPASETTIFTFSSESKIQTPVADIIMSSVNHDRNPIYFTEGLIAEVDYRFINAGFSVSAGKNLEGKLGIYPAFLYGLIIPVNHSRFLLGHGYSFVEKEVYARFGYSYFFKNGITVGLETNHPTKFSFRTGNWTELNHLKELIMKSQLVLKVGYTPTFSFNKNPNNNTANSGLFPSNDWYFRFTQSILFSGFGFFNKNGRTRIGVDVSVPLLYGICAYSKDRIYNRQIIDATLFSSIRMDATFTYEFPINNSGFVATLQAGLTSLWFNGQYTYIPEYFQAYSLNTGASLEYWLNEKNGFFIEGNVPTLTFYFNEGEKTPRVKTLFNDNNVKTVINYMTKVGYVHKIKTR